MFTFKLIEDTVESPREEIVTVSSRDIVRWERRNPKKNSFKNLGEDLRMGDLYELGWVTATRLRLTDVKTLDEFIDQWELKLITKDDEEDEDGPEDPTR